MIAAKKDKIIVAHMIPMGAGGISSVTLNMYDYLDHDKIEYCYLIFRDEKEFFEERVKKDGCKKIIVNLQKIHNPLLRMVYKLFVTGKKLKENHVRVMHVDASTPYDVLIGISAKMYGIPKVIMHSHSNGVEKTGHRIRNFLMPVFKAIIPLVTDEYIACSESAAKFMFPRKILKRHRYILLKNAINGKQYQYNESIRNFVRQEMHLNGKFVIGHIGRFMVEKNHMFLIEIFNEIHKINKNAILLLIGTGEMEDIIRKKVKAFGIDKYVIFYGTSHEVEKLLQAMDIFVFPSLYEGLGIAAIEGQAAGLVTVCSTAIPPEAKISDLFIYMDLKQSSFEWASKINEYYHSYNRRNMINVVEKAGYDLHKTSIELQKIYYSLFELV